MIDSTNAEKITEKVYWVGALDWALRDFHGYATLRGTSYNAFLILAEKVTLVDTVHASFKDEMFSRIASVIDPAKIDYVISNHSELDHTGCLPDVIEEVRPEKVFSSQKGQRAIEAHFHNGSYITAVADGERLSLGDMTVKFMETRMLHWPDSMFSYLEDERILFSQDGFGMHLAHGERYTDAIDSTIIKYEAKKYYANILLPFSPTVQKILDKSSGLDVAMVAPDHGPIWRKDIDKILGWYRTWAEQKPSNKAVIVYDTMWGSTQEMAGAIEDGLRSEGIQVRSMRLRENHRSDIVTELLDAGAVLVGSPTLNNNVFPTVADILSYMKGLKRKNLIGAAFGSYGWSGEASKQISEALTAMNVEVVEPPLSVEYVPDVDACAMCREFGASVGRQLKQRVQG